MQIWRRPQAGNTKGRQAWQSSLIALIAATVLLGVVWAIALERVKYERERAVTDEIRKNANLAQSHQERASRSFQIIDQALLFLRTDFLAYGLPTSLAARVGLIRLDKKFLGSVALLGSQGEVLAEAGKPLPPGMENRDAFLTHAKDNADRLVIGKAVQVGTDGTWSMTLSRRISRADGSFAGVVLMTLDPAFFATDYQLSEQDAFGSMALIGSDGFIRARRTGDKLSFGADNRASQVFKELAKAPHGNYISPSPSDGHRRIVAYRMLDEYPMLTAVGSSLETVLALSKARESVYLGAAAATTVIGVLLTIGYLRVAGRRALVRANLQASVAEKTALLLEVHHRVKNNLQVITSLLRLEIRRSEHNDTTGVLKHMQSRVRSMALLHETIYRNGTFAAIDLGRHLREVATQSLQVLQAGPGHVELRLEVGLLQVGLEQATPCGLLISELVSNCLKHGFPNHRDGEIFIQLSPLEQPGWWRLRVSDNGAGLPSDFEARRQEALGLQLADDMARQMGGTLDIGPGPKAVFTVDFKSIPPASLVFAL